MLQISYGQGGWWGVGTYCPHKNPSSPQSVSDHSAAAQVLDLEAQVTVPVISLKQRVVGVRTKKLGKHKRHNINETETIYWF